MSKKISAKESHLKNVVNDHSEITGTDYPIDSNITKRGLDVNLLGQPSVSIDRAYDRLHYNVLDKILEELEKINLHLSIITGEEL